METSNWSDLLFGSLALLIVIAGLFMLFQGISAMGDKEK
jgi:hypothetical protein